MNVQAQHSPAARIAAVSTHPIAELLECPPDTSSLLNGASQCIHLRAGDVAFRQGEESCGLYLVVAGEFLRKSERLNTRVTLGSIRAGDIVELAAVLSGIRHTYTLTAISDATLLLLPVETLNVAFERHPPLRMRLLQELAREVSRAYITCCMTRSVPARRHRNSNGHNDGSNL